MVTSLIAMPASDSCRRSDRQRAARSRVDQCDPAGTVQDGRGDNAWHLLEVQIEETDSRGKTVHWGIITETGGWGLGAGGCRAGAGSTELARGAGSCDAGRAAV